MLQQEQLHSPFVSASTASSATSCSCSRPIVDAMVEAADSKGPHQSDSSSSVSKQLSESSVTTFERTASGNKLRREQGLAEWDAECKAAQFPRRMSNASLLSESGAESPTATSISNARSSRLTSNAGASSSSELPSATPSFTGGLYTPAMSRNPSGNLEDIERLAAISVSQAPSQPSPWDRKARVVPGKYNLQLASSWHKSPWANKPRAGAPPAASSSSPLQRQSSSGGEAPTLARQLSSRSVTKAPTVTLLAWASGIW